jgi:hypothetical protein
MNIIKTKRNVTIARKDWEKLRANPVLTEAIELFEDISDLAEAKKVRGKTITISQYLKKRGIQSSH